MIRTNTVPLTVIPAIAYRQKLPAEGSGITILRYGAEQPGLASISRSTGSAIPSPNTSRELYPLEAFTEAIALTSGMPYRNQRGVKVNQTIPLESVWVKQPTNELRETAAIVDSEEYQRLVDIYTDSAGKLSYELLNRGFIQFAYGSGQVRQMVEEKMSADDIRFYIVKNRLRSITRNPTLTDAQILEMVELLDEVSQKGVFRPLNDQIRQWLTLGKLR